MLENFIKIFGAIGNNFFVLEVNFCNLAKKKKKQKTKQNHVNFVFFGKISPTFELKIIKLTTSKPRHFLNWHL
jgi:hypothetical protein